MSQLSKSRICGKECISFLNDNSSFSFSSIIFNFNLVFATLNDSHRLRIAEARDQLGLT